MNVISDRLLHQRCRYKWKLLFDNLPQGADCHAKWEDLGAKKTDVPSDELLLDLFQHTPTAVILVEFQT